MYLQSLHIENFRNLTEQTVGLGPGFNYVYGPNGAGKTAFLEAIYLLARGRSFRTSKTATLIAHEKPQLLLRASLLNSVGQSVQIGMSKTRSGKTELRVNGSVEQRASTLAKHLPVQTLLPQAADLVLGGPGARRGFLDWGVFHVEQRFVDVSRDYRRALAQRNAWLKSLRGDDPGFESDPWVVQVCDCGVQISEMRASYVEQFAPLFTRALETLSAELSVELAYDRGGLESSAQAQKKMGEAWSRDVKFGVTHRGPHRGDLRFSTRQQDVSDTVSRGQAKLISSAAILAQAELLFSQSNTKSLILIDDFGAELDAQHWQQFLRTLMALECQVVATSTERLDSARSWLTEVQEMRVFHVKQGQFEQQEFKEQINRSTEQPNT